MVHIRENQELVRTSSMSCFNSPPRTRIDGDWSLKPDCKANEAEKCWLNPTAEPIPICRQTPAWILEDEFVAFCAMVECQPSIGKLLMVCRIIAGKRSGDELRSLELDHG